MGHYAKVNENNIVIQVIVATADFINTLPDKDSYIKTSYNTYAGKHYVPAAEGQNFSVLSDDQSKALRKNFAGIGMTYDPIRDAFISAKPFDSWVLNETTCCWEAPLPYPGSSESTSIWLWDEALYQSDNTRGWVEDP